MRTIIIGTNGYHKANSLKEAKADGYNTKGYKYTVEKGENIEINNKYYTASEKYLVIDNTSE